MAREETRSKDGNVFAAKVSLAGHATTNAARHHHHEYVHYIIQ